MQLILGIVFIIMGVGMIVTLGSSGMGIIVASGVLFLIVYAWGKGTAIVKLEDDHMEMKAAIAAPRKMVLYTEMKSIDRVSDKKAFLIFNQDGKENKLRLPLNVLTDEDRKVLLGGLTRKMKG